MTNKEKQFLTLRANGSTFDAIAKELKVSKPTLVKWSKLYEDDINDLVALSLLALKEEYSYTQKKKYETLLK